MTTGAPRRPPLLVANVVVMAAFAAVVGIAYARRLAAGPPYPGGPGDTVFAVFEGSIVAATVLQARALLRRSPKEAGLLAGFFFLGASVWVAGLVWAVLESFVLTKEGARAIDGVRFVRIATVLVGLAAYCASAAMLNAIWKRRLDDAAGPPEGKPAGPIGDDL